MLDVLKAQPDAPCELGSEADVAAAASTPCIAHAVPDLPCCPGQRHLSMNTQAGPFKFACCATLARFKVGSTGFIAEGITVSKGAVSFCPQAQALSWVPA